MTDHDPLPYRSDSTGPHDRDDVEQFELPFDECDSDTASETSSTAEVVSDVIPLTERLRIIKQELGFYPVNRGEANEAFGLMDDSSNPVARHLYEIVRHQEKAATDNPLRTLGSVVDEYRSYASRARFDITALAEMRDKLFEPDRVDMTQSLDEFGIIDGAAQLTRYLDTLDIVGSGKTDIYGFDGMMLKSDGRRQAYDAYTGTQQPPKAVRTRIQHRLETVTVGQARAGVDSLISDQRSRYGFWKDVLIQAEKYPKAREMARLALKKL